MRGAGRRYDLAYGGPPGLPDGADLLAAAACAAERDGLLFHRSKGRIDRAKQNPAIVRGTPLLRYGWQETTEAPCATAAELIAVGKARGLNWPVHPCRRSG